MPFFDLFTIDTSDFLCRLMRPLFFALLYLLIRRRMPVGVISLSRRLWKLILGLSFMPLCALMAVVLLTYRKWDSMVANSMAMNQDGGSPLHWCDGADSFVCHFNPGQP
mgnify:CR=1 FL=1